MFEIFKLNLDTKDFVKGAGEANKLIGEIGSGESLDGLVKNLGKATQLIGAVGVAYLAVKNAVDWVEEAENIKKVEERFNLLGASAGIATNTLKEGLEKSAGGLIDNTDLLESANKAIVALGNNAKKLPEIMELARKATAVFGGDAQQNFEAINQAIATGQTRGLKQLGLTVDLTKAYKDYATSIGATASTLSESGKQAALMDAVLEKGRDRFKSINADAQSTANLFKQIGVILNELKETFVLVFEKTAGPLLRDTLANLRDWAGYLKDNVIKSTDAWKESLDGTNYAIQDTWKHIQRLKAEVLEIDEGNTPIWKRIFGSPEHQKEIYLKTISELEEKMNSLKDKRDQLKSGTEEPDVGAKEDSSKIDQEKRRQQEEAFQKDILAIKKQGLDDQMANAQSFEEVDRIHQQQKLLLEQETSNQIKTIQDSDKLNQEQKAQEIEALNNNLNEKLKSFDDDLKAQRLKSIDTWEQRQVQAGNAMSGAMAADSKRAQANFVDLQKTGHTVFTSIGTNAKSAFKAMGDGSKDAGQAMRGFIMGAIADTAEAKGEEMLLAGIWPPNPVAIAAGGGLIALASALRSQAGGASQGIGGAGGGSGGGGSLEGINTQDSNTQSVQQREKKSVVVAFNGPIINTEETRQFIAQTVRDNTDATDFKITELGI